MLGRLQCTKRELDQGFLRYDPGADYRYMLLLCCIVLKRRKHIKVLLFAGADGNGALTVTVQISIQTDARACARPEYCLKKKLPLIAANHVSFCIPPQCFLLVSHAVEATMRLLIHLRMRLFTARCHQTGVIPPPVEISHHKSQYTPTDHIKHIMSIILQSAHGNQCRSEQWCQTAQHDH